ncbi:MAG: PAS domain-containing protein [Chitinophagaceae bacterium]|nr:PAS domain-containing protein [Chitinophagaceae bacterium]
MDKKALYSFLVSFILMVAVIIINRQSFNKMREYTGWVNHGRVVMARFEKLSNHFKSAQIYSENYSNKKTKEFYDFYKAEADSVKNEIAGLQWIVAIDPQQKRRMDTVGKQISNIMPLLMKYNIVEIIQDDMNANLDKIIGIQTLINEGIQYERTLLDKRAADLEKSTNLTRVFTLLFSIIALLIVIITFVTIVFINRKRQWLQGFLESILNTTPNGVMTFKAIRENGRIINFEIEYANKAIERLLNQKLPDIIGMKLNEFPPAMQQKGLLQRISSVVEGKRKDAIEMQFKAGNRHRWFYIMFAKMEDGITATFHDITVIKNYEEELKENIRKLEHSNAELEQYAYAASHDLQEPLRKIRMYVSRLHERIKDKLDDKSHHDFDRILNSAERMSLLIRDILSFSGLNRDSGFQKTDLNKILQNVIDDQEVLIQQKKALIHADELPEIIAIPLQMNQLFYNLLNNALKFAREDQPLEFKISSAFLSPADIRKYKNLSVGRDYIKLEFSDNGVGFDESFSEHIFGLFKRLGNQESIHGSGIGLALCRKVVENHQGIIFANAKENDGATFFIILPVKHDVEENSIPKTSATLQQPALKK